MTHNAEDHDCTTMLVEMKATPEVPYRFVDAGLPNVELVGIRYFVCKVCKRIVKAEIPAVKDLLDALGRAVVTKVSPLTGDQLRFLRKRLGIRQADFASVLKVSAEQLSRLENEHSTLTGAMEGYVRLAYTFMSKDTKLKKFAQSVQQNFCKWATSIHGSGTNEHITAEYKANRQWTAEAVPAAA